MTQIRKRSKKWIYWLVFVVLAVVAVIVGFLVYDNYFRDKGISENEEVEEIEKAEEGGAGENESSDSAAFTVNVHGEKKVKQYEGEDPNEAEGLSGAVTYAGVNSGVLTIGVNIDQFLTEGICKLSLVRGGEAIYSESVNIIADVSTSSCDGVNISVDRLGKGKTEIVIELDADGKAGMVRGEVEL